MSWVDLIIQVQNLKDRLQVLEKRNKTIMAELNTLPWWRLGRRKELANELDVMLDEMSNIHNQLTNIETEIKIKVKGVA